MSEQVVCRRLVKPSRGRNVQAVVLFLRIITLDCKLFVSSSFGLLLILLLFF